MKKNPTKDNKDRLQFTEWNLPQFDCHISVWFRSTRKFKEPKTPEEMVKFTIERCIKSVGDELLSLTNLDIIGGIPFRGKEPFEFVDNITSFNIVSVSLIEYREHIINKILED